MINLKKLFNLKGRTALITGASGHLAEKISYILADQGSDLILIARNNRYKNNYDANLKKNFPNLKIKKIICDLSKENSRNNLVKKIKNQKIDILVNNATFKENNSIGYASSFKSQNLKKWRSSFEINLTAVFHLSQSLYKNMKKSKNATIINVSSIYGIYSPDLEIYRGTKLGNSAAYASAKAGLIQLTKWLSRTLAPGIRVNCISPGGIYRDQPKKFVKAYIKKTAIKRMAKEDDLMGVFAFLASDASAYVTGQNIIVDGGWGN